MSDNANSSSSSLDTLLDNEQVKSLLAILIENKISTDELRAVIGHVGEMERQLSVAVTELTDMRREIAKLRHPLKTSALNIIRTLETKYGEVKARLDKVKTSIVEGAKKAISAFKEKGASELLRLASFLHIRDGLEMVRDIMQHDIWADEKTISDIASASREYHKIGRDVKNLMRVIQGKETSQEVKPEGRVAALAQAVFKMDKAQMSFNIRCIDKMLGALSRLEQKFPEKSLSGSVPSPAAQAVTKNAPELEHSLIPATAEERPSVRARLVELKAQQAPITPPMRASKEQAMQMLK